MSKKKTAQLVAEQSEQTPKKKRGGGAARNPRSLANLVAPWKKGESGNPSGKPGFDVAAFIARKVVESNKEEIYKGLAKQLMQGNAYAFSVVADRGYGKLKEKLELSADEEIVSRLLAGRKRLAK